MASITIRNLDESIKTDLRILAAQHGNSMEEEARQILQRALASNTSGLGSKIAQRFAAMGGIELPPPIRTLTRPAPDLGE
ncbi:MAG: plasmid stabilization protein [Sulfuriferula sp.]|nr:plasmid stabilization protein [Sulfuriferula sp.]